MTRHGRRRAGALACGSVPTPPIPTARASAAGPWRSTGTSSRASLGEQLRALGRVCRAAGTAIESVKPHGALYEEVAKGGAIYETFRDAVRECLRRRAPPWCCRRAAGPWPWCCATAWRRREEGFCDRAYRPDGGLVDRGEPGAVLHDPEEAAGQALSLARGAVAAGDGTILTLWVDTLCIHGDSPGAVAIATAVRRALAEAGIDVVAPARA